MRIAVLSDIHGNGVALEAVLNDITRERVDQIVCLGDVVANGPLPKQVLDRLRQVGCTSVMGNTDEWFLDPQPFEPSTDKEQRLADLVQWGVAQLSAADIDTVRAFEPRLELPLGEGQSLLGFHGSPHSNIHILSAMTPDDDLARMLSGYHAAIMAGGHTHTQMLRRFRDMILINPGSVGMALERGVKPDQFWNPPRAEYAIVAVDGTSRIEFRRVSYSLDDLTRAVRDGGMAQADWWLKDHRESFG